MRNRLMRSKFFLITIFLATAMLLMAAAQGEEGSEEVVSVPLPNLHRPMIPAICPEFGAYRPEDPLEAVGQ